MRTVFPGCFGCAVLSLFLAQSPAMAEDQNLATALGAETLGGVEFNVFNFSNSQSRMTISPTLTSATQKRCAEQAKPEIAKFIELAGGTAQLKSQLQDKRISLKIQLMDHSSIQSTQYQVDNPNFFGGVSSENGSSLNINSFIVADPQSGQVHCQFPTGDKIYAAVFRTSARTDLLPAPVVPTDRHCIGPSPECTGTGEMFQ